MPRSMAFWMMVSTLVCIPAMLALVPVPVPRYPPLTFTPMAARMTDSFQWSRAYSSAALLSGKVLVS
jgi:hypothetical protein